MPVKIKSTGASALVEGGGRVIVMTTSKIVPPDMRPMRCTGHPAAQVLSTQDSVQVGVSWQTDPLHAGCESPRAVWRLTTGLAWRCRRFKTRPLPTLFRHVARARRTKQGCHKTCVLFMLIDCVSACPDRIRNLTYISHAQGLGGIITSDGLGNAVCLVEDHPNFRRQPEDHQGESAPSLRR